MTGSVLRAQLKVTQGRAAMPLGGFYVGRHHLNMPASVLANPFPVSTYGREESLQRYRARLKDLVAKRSASICTILWELRRRAEAGATLTLYCWCSLDEACHADIVKEAILSWDLG